MTDKLSFAESMEKPKSNCAYCGKRLKFAGGDFSTIVGLGSHDRASHCRACGKEQPERTGVFEAVGNLNIGERLAKRKATREHRANAVRSTGNADRLAGRPEQAAREAQWAAAAAAKAAGTSTAKAPAAPPPPPPPPAPVAGDIVNGHRLDIIDGEWVWTPVTL